MARMPHYACTPGGRVREWVTDWRTSSSRIHLRASTCAQTRLFCRVLGAPHTEDRCAVVHTVVYCGSVASSVFILSARCRRGVSANSGCTYEKIWAAERYSEYLIVIKYRNLEKAGTESVGYMKKLKRTRLFMSGRIFKLDYFSQFRLLK